MPICCPTSWAPSNLAQHRPKKPAWSVFRPIILPESQRCSAVRIKILLLPAFDPDSWLTLASEERASNAFVVPTMLSRIIARMEEGTKADLSSLQAIAYGGGPMPVVVI